MNKLIILFLNECGLDMDMENSQFPKCPLEILLNIWYCFRINIWLFADSHNMRNSLSKTNTFLWQTHFLLSYLLFFSLLNEHFKIALNSISFVSNVFKTKLLYHCNYSWILHIFWLNLIIKYINMRSTFVIKCKPKQKLWVL